MGCQGWTWSNVNLGIRQCIRTQDCRLDHLVFHLSSPTGKQFVVCQLPMWRYIGYQRRGPLSSRRLDVGWGRYGQVWPTASPTRQASSLHHCQLLRPNACYQSTPLLWFCYNVPAVVSAASKHSRKWLQYVLMSRKFPIRDVRWRLKVTYCSCFISEEVHSLVDVFIKSNDPLQVLQSAVSVMTFLDEILIYYLPMHSTHLHPGQPFDLGPSPARNRSLHRTSLAQASFTAACTSVRFRRIVGMILPLPLSLVQRWI